MATGSKNRARSRAPEAEEKSCFHLVRPLAITFKLCNCDAELGAAYTAANIPAEKIDGHPASAAWRSRSRPSIKNRAPPPTLEDKAVVKEVLPVSETPKIRPREDEPKPDKRFLGNDGDDNNDGGGGGGDKKGIALAGAAAEEISEAPEEIVMKNWPTTTITIATLWFGIAGL